MRNGSDHHLGGEARRLLDRLDRGGHLERAQAVTAWQEVAGAEVTRHATGYAMRGSELVVFVDAGVWAAELAALSERYRTAVNEQLGREMVGSIRFTVSRKARGDDEGDTSAAHETASRVEPVPLDEVEEAQLQDMASTISDEPLRQAALGAAKRHLEWQKGLKGRKTP